MDFSFRYTIRDQILDDGMVSELGISHTYRQDTGIYICQASNAFGQVSVMQFKSSNVFLELISVYHYLFVYSELYGILSTKTTTKYFFRTSVLSV